MSNNFYLPKDFLETKTYKNYSSNVQIILEKIITALNLKSIAYVIKIGKGKNQIITLSLENKPSSNIASVYIHKEHVRIRLRQEVEIRISLEDDITIDDIVIDILDKYSELTRGKRQCSIYVYADTMDKIDEIAKKAGKKPNEIIEQFLDEKTADLFISQRHKLEFVSLLKQADMFNDNINHSDTKVLQRIAIFYLVAAFQKEYKEDTGEKFSIAKSGDELIFKGPVYLFKEWELGYKKSETVLGLALYIKDGSNDPRILIDILQDMSVNNISYLAENAFNILSERYEIDTVSRDVLVAPKTKIINLDEIPNFIF